MRDLSMYVKFVTTSVNFADFYVDI